MLRHAIIGKWKLKLLILCLLGTGMVVLLLSMSPGIRRVLGQAQAQADDYPNLRRTLPVKVIRLNQLSPPDRLDSYRGTIEASKSSNLSFRRSGRLTQIHVREGDRISQGNVLATLDTSDLQASLRGIESRIDEALAQLAEQEAGPREQSIKSAEAVLREREAAWNLAKLTLAREESLQKSRASSQQAYDEARMGLDRAAAAVQAAREQLDELREGTRREQIDAQKARVQSLRAQRDDLLVQLSDGELIAPFSGVIARRFVDEGIISSPDRAVLRVLQVDPLEARFGLAAEDASRLQPGDSVRVSKGSLFYPATVSRIEPELDPATRTQGIIVSVSRPESPSDLSERDWLVPGQTVSLSLSANPAADNEFWIPIQALTRSIRGLWSILVVEERSDGWTVERHDVQVLEVDGGLARIRATTVQGDNFVIAEGIHRITPDIVVEPVFDLNE
jgi:HlyD family secretion protein